nr:leukemia inhibitory factor [Pelodiscus sinensis]|eukprot:XP_006136764.1 leukemia inhibitory factor [Pelodiscus sinensis]
MSENSRERHSPALGMQLKMKSLPAGDPFSSHADQLCKAEGIFFPAFHANRTSPRKDVLVALYQVVVFLNASLGNITRDQKELNPEAQDLLERLHNTTKTARGLFSNLTCLLCTKYRVDQVDVV